MNDRIRVLHIIGQLGVGGAEMQLLGLCRRMNHSRFEMRVICYSLSDDSLAPQFRDAGVEVVEFDKFSMSLWRFFRELRHCVQECEPHIVHTWLYSANFWGRWAAVTANVRAIVASDRAVVTRSGGVTLLSERLLKRRTMRLANSESIARSLEQQLGIRADKVKIVRNAVELAAIDRKVAAKEIRAEIGAEEGQKIVLMVGRQTWEKNYPMFIRAADIVGQRRHDVRFVAVGRYAGDARVAEEMSRTADGNAVQFVGQRDDVYRWYAAADVFCLTSDTEGFPNVVLEAMWSQCPVICTDFPSALEMVTDPTVGIIVPRGDAATLATEIIRLLDNEDHRHELGMAAAAHARKYYGWDALVDAMQRIYEERASST